MSHWSNSDVLVGSGILILPNQLSTGLLIGAVFLQDAFPDILSSGPPRPRHAIPSGVTMAVPPSSFVVSASSQSQSIVRQVSQGSSAHGPPGHSRASQQLVQNESHYPSGNMKAYSDELCSPTAMLRQNLANAAFDPFVFEDTTDGSGCTSPGSTRPW